jgi:hypothetical protein
MKPYFILLLFLVGVIHLACAESSPNKSSDSLIFTHKTKGIKKSLVIGERVKIRLQSNQVKYGKIVAINDSNIVIKRQKVEQTIIISEITFIKKTSFRSIIAFLLGIGFLGLGIYFFAYGWSQIDPYSFMIGVLFGLVFLFLGSLFFWLRKSKKRFNLKKWAIKAK